MPLPETHSATFKLIRVTTFSVASLASIAWASLYAVILIQGWDRLDIEQRVITMIMFAIYAISALLLYLLIIVDFRLWLEGLRVVLIVAFQLVGTVFFALFRSSSPHFCPGFTSNITICDVIQTIPIYGGWASGALLLIYAFFLVTLSYRPPMDVENYNPNPDSWDSMKNKSKRSLSLGSATSTHSRSSSHWSYRASPVPVPPTAQPKKTSPRMPLTYIRSDAPSANRGYASPTPSVGSLSSSYSLTTPKSLIPGNPRPGPSGIQWARAGISRPSTAASVKSTATIMRSFPSPPQQVPMSRLPPPGLDDYRLVPPQHDSVPFYPPISAPPTITTMQRLPNPHAPVPALASQPISLLLPLTPRSSGYDASIDTRARAPSRDKSVSHVPRSPSTDSSYSRRSVTIPNSPQSAPLPDHPPLHPTTAWDMRKPSPPLDPLP